MLDEKSRANLESAIVRAQAGEHVNYLCPSEQMVADAQEALLNDRRATRTTDLVFIVGAGSVILEWYPRIKRD